ncbi:peptidoglycan-associated lipoprotein Pal [Croceibacterium sp. LX-88]|jgi:peptidoglycan-associated lipoprotein|uniref:Peptidoglycan-associated lipoprotein n=1 Tax=Croceibacterium selenioxidans TaxID=2838833 RepID=A0ABS5VZ47_9SPHN|nr:peptidoglycan-associated lipoprotein Pal [Croceibacterium selenioxidans]MBT2132791.1 peptidoglycan-associated lipoprotein Pal [Croceibacterium selenioxidans]
MNKTAIAVTLASALALSACSKKAPEELPPPPQTTTPTPSGPPPQTGPIPGSQAHFAQAMQGRDTIYFDTDQYNIDPEDQAALRQQAQYMQQYADIRATIEGHADERGTREYNLALGERRATAARNYLVSLGISPDRLNTVSYGKERPIALGSDQASWARNRRAVTVILN